MSFGVSWWRASAVTCVAVVAALVFPVAAQADPTPVGTPTPTTAGADAESLRGELAAAQAQFQQAQQQQATASELIAQLKRQIDADQAASDAAKAQIQRYARWAYIAARDAEVANLMSRLAAGDQDSLAEAQILLSSAGNVQVKQLRDAVEVLQRNQALRQRQLQVQADATAAMAAAQAKGQEVVAKLTALAALLGPEPSQPSLTARTCPVAAPPGTLTGGAAQIGVYQLCTLSVQQARSPSAARAIVWAFNHLGAPYIDGGVPIDVENYNGFNCANYIARAYYWGARISGFLTLPWTPAYATPPAFLRDVGVEHRAGDINLMWRSEVGIAGSGGQAGHAQLFIADGWVIQSGGTAGMTNVAPYPNGWPGWQEVHFSVETVANTAAGAANTAVPPGLAPSPSATTSGHQ